MQRQPISPLIIILAVVAFLTACTPAAHYDGRLAAADSLMHDRPDSALAILQALHPDSLATQGDHAYRDLLLTQARYKCYITATTDSAINRALHYYRRHSHEQEKLTRAYIYKGAVMEELGHPDSAMHYYKTAEATAAPDDYFNLAYTKMQMGALYRNNYAMDGKHIEKFEEAQAYFQKAKEEKYLLICMINLGSLYRLKNPDKSLSTLLSAKSFALQLNDTAQYYNCLKGLIETYYIQKDYDNAYQLINEAFALGDIYHDLEFCTNAADVLAKLGMPDSAALILNLCRQPEPANVIEKIFYMESVGEIALARGDTNTYVLMDNRCRHINDSLLALNSPMSIMKAELTQDKTLQQQKHQQHRVTSLWLIAIIASLLMIIIIVGYQFYNRKHRYDKLISELRETTDAKIRELEQLQDKINDLDIQDNKLKDYFDSHLWVMREIIEQCYHIPNSKLVQKLKNTLCYQEQNKDQWTKLNFYIDMRYNHILSKTMKQYPQLNDRDILLVALTTLDFSCIQIAMILGYSNPTSIGVVRQRLAKKMGIDCTLKQYIDQQIHI